MNNKNYSKPNTEDELIEVFKQVAKNEFNWDCDIPVKINSQLKTSLGRFIYQYKNKQIIPLGFDFNINSLNKDYDLEKLLNTIRHELVHWYTDTTENKACKHNEIFISNCNKFGVNDFTNFDRYRPRKKLDKGAYHEAKCCGCDRVVAKGTSIVNLKRYMGRYGGTVCSCNNGKRYIIDKGIKRIYHHGLSPFGSRKEEQWLDELAKDYKIILCK